MTTRRMIVMMAIIAAATSVAKAMPTADPEEVQFTVHQHDMAIQVIQPFMDSHLSNRKPSGHNGVFRHGSAVETHTKWPQRLNAIGMALTRLRGIPTPSIIV